MYQYALDHVSIYGIDRLDEENAENMYKMFVNLRRHLLPKECQLYMENSPNSFAQNTSMAHQRTTADLCFYCEGFNNFFLIFKIVVFVPLMKYQDWSLKLLVNDLRH